MNLEAALVIFQLASPLLVILASRRHLLLAAIAVFCVQGLTAWLAGCITHTWQCQDTCALLMSACVPLGDDNDAAPLGIAVLTLLSATLLVITSIVKLLFHHWKARARRQGDQGSVYAKP